MPFAPAYVVFSGRAPGVYDTWAKVEPLVKAFSGARHKKYSSSTEAFAAYASFTANPDEFQLW